MLGRKETESLNETLTYRCPETEKYLLLFDTMLEWNGSKKDWKRQFNAGVPKNRFTEYSDAAEFFTGARLEKVAEWSKDEYLVMCVGYYAACGA